MCVSVSAGEPPPDKIRTLAKGAFSGFQKETYLVVTNQTQWAEVWKKNSAQQTPAKPLPKVDFEKETVLLAAAGQKQTGGHSIEIVRIDEIADKTAVIIKVTAPRPGGFSIQALTAPFHIVAVPRIKGPVLFKRE